MTTVAAILKHKGYQVTTTDPTATIATLVIVLAEHRIDETLVTVDGTIPVAPTAPNLEIRLIDVPARPAPAARVVTKLAHFVAHHR